jgi:hypothetical protein
MTKEDEKRIAALTHLRGAVMHIEASMSIDSGTWTYDQVKQIRDARDSINELGYDLSL